MSPTQLEKPLAPGTPVLFWSACPNAYLRLMRFENGRTGERENRRQDAADGQEERGIVCVDLGSMNHLGGHV